MENVDDQVSLLRAKVAGVDKSKAALVLAQLDFDRAAKLVVTNDAPREVYDRRQAELLAARADVVASLADVRQIRASLGLPPTSDEADLGQVPPNLDQTFSSVLQAQAAVIQSAAQLGVIHSFDEGPRDMVEAFEKEGDVNTAFARLAADAPDVKQAEAKLEVAKRDLDQAELDLRYCDVVAEIDGVVRAATSIRAIMCRLARRSWRSARSMKSGLTLISRRRSSATCASASLSISMSTCMAAAMCSRGAFPASPRGPDRPWLCCRRRTPTGNFIKVVQRLPVRIDLENSYLDKNPLFIGTSVVPYVLFKEPPTGPDAGKFLQTYAPEPPTGGSTANPPGANK